jgi:hypothetical protein
MLTCAKGVARFPFAPPSLDLTFRGGDPKSAPAPRESAAPIRSRGVFRQLRKSACSAGPCRPQISAAEDGRVSAERNGKDER